MLLNTKCVFWFSEDILGKDQFGFRSRRGNTDVTGMLRMSEQTLDIDEDCSCFTDWQKACDCVNWTKLMHILQGTVIDWRERRLIN
jgi:hypothetical protein